MASSRNLAALRVTYFLKFWTTNYFRIPSHIALNIIFTLISHKLSVMTWVINLKLDYSVFQTFTVAVKQHGNGTLREVRDSY